MDLLNGVWPSEFTVGSIATPPGIQWAASRNGSKAPAAPSITSFSPDTGVVGDGFTSANQLILTGIAEANSVVQIFDGTTQLGMATVNASGAWSFATGPQSDGVHAFTAKAMDAAGNTSQASSALTVTVNAQAAGPIPTSYFGMTVEAPGYAFAGLLEAWPTMPISIVRSLDVWSPGNGSISTLTWADLNPSAGVYNFSELDAWINECQSHGVQMIYTLTNPPVWAGGTNPDPAALQAFVTALMTHTAGRIQYIEGFNEFTSFTTVSPSDMVKLQQVLYQTAHRIDASSTVLSPTVSDTSEKSFLAFLQAGGGNWFDVAAMHGYNNTTGEGIIPVIENFRAALIAAGQGDKPIWDTEWGWWNASTATPDVLPDQIAQVAFVSRSLILQWALGVQRQLYYAYDNVNHGIYNYNTQSLTAAGVAYQETEQWLAGATMPNGYQVSGTVYSALLTRGDQNSLLVWDSGGSSSYSAGPYTQYVDLTGKVHAVTNGVVTIGPEPILLETRTPSASMR